MTVELLSYNFFISFYKYSFQRKLEGYEFPVYSTDICPRNQIEWNKRSSAINCTETNGYMCLPNENLTELTEFCYMFPRILIENGTKKLTAVY